MATLSQSEIDELMKQLKEKTEEIKDIYNKLVEAGVVSLPDDYLDLVSGGRITAPPIIHNFSGPKHQDRT